MKRMPAFLAMALAALVWAADARAQMQLPDEPLAAMKVNPRELLATHSPNPYLKLSAHLPDSDAPLGGNRVNDHLRLGAHLPASTANISGFLPLNREKLGASPDYAGRDDLSTVGINPHTKLAGFKPAFREKLGAQWPSPHTD